MAKNWYKLDNAAKIFPAIFTKKDTNSFRISSLFYENINPDALQKSIQEALVRFPTFCVKLKRGFFWYYFEHNNKKPIIMEENSIAFDSVRLYKNNGYLFTLSYHERRLTLEVFHALSDGTGSMEFFKCICYYYLLFLGHDIENTGEIKTQDVEQNIAESDDSFNLNYDQKIKKHSNEGKAFQLKGRSYNNRWVGLIHAQMDVSNLKEAAHRYDATITEYIGGVILFSIYNLYFKDRKQKRSAKLFFPVNARKYFDSNTLRNFALYVRTTCDLNKLSSLSLKESIEIIKDTFNNELTKEKLLSRIVSNVSMERLWIVRILPLFIKNIAMRIGYKVLGSDVNTLSFSNLGEVKLPKEMGNYIERFEFTIGASKATPINFSSVSYNGIFVLTISTKHIDRDLIRNVIRQFSSDGIHITLESNNLEVDD